MSEDKKAFWLTVAFSLLCTSLLLLFTQGASAAWYELDEEDYPSEGIAITDYDELSLVEEYKYLGMEDDEDPDSLTLGASSGPPPSGDSPGRLSIPEQQELLSQVKAIREDISLFLYGVLPVLLAAVVLYKFCVWFYRTFIAGAFE